MKWDKMFHLCKFNTICFQTLQYNLLLRVETSQFSICTVSQFVNAVVSWSAITFCICSYLYFCVVIVFVLNFETYQFVQFHSVCIPWSVDLWLLFVGGGFRIILQSLNHFQIGEWKTELDGPKYITVSVLPQFSWAWLLSSSAN